jgi:hypothetical protein
VLLVVIGSGLLAIAVVGLMQRVAGKELRGYFINSTKRLRALRFAVAVPVAGTLALIFDFLDASQLAEGKGDWHQVALAGAFSFFGVVYLWMAWNLWACENLLESSTSSLASSVRDLEAQKAFLQQELQLHRKVSSLLIQILTERWRRIRDYLNSRSRLPLHSPIHLTELESIFGPTHQIRMCVASLHAVILDQFNGGIKDGHTLRVALFEPVGEYLVPTASFDGHKHDCVKGSVQPDLRERFRLTGASADRSLAVFASTQHFKEVPLMIPDADDANRDPASAYRHLTAEQSQRIKSIAAYPCHDCTPTTKGRPVIVCDTNQVGFFSSGEAQAHTLRRILQDFAARMLNECTIKELLALAGEEKR